MKRRSFLKNSTLAGASFFPILAFESTNERIQINNFNLKYAPHFGMFKNYSGTDLLNQLKFMRDSGFTAFEDNGMKDRSIATQNKIGKFLNDNNMEMGVFVAHKIHWKKPNLASGNID